MTEYIAAIFEGDGGGVEVVFQDFPGCVTKGANLDEAKSMAEEALALHAEGMEEDCEACPKPMGLEAARRNELCQGADAFFFVRLPARHKSVRVNVTLPEDVLSEIDAYAKANGYTRSGLLLRGAREIVRRGEDSGLFCDCS